MNDSYEKRGAKMRKKKRNTIFRDLLTLCLTVVLVLVTPQPQPVQAAGSKPVSMTLNMSQKTIDLNSIYQIKVKTVKPKKASKAVLYKTSNSKIASVSAKGIVKGKKEGTVKITVQSKANKKLKKTVKITVKRLRPYSLSLNKQELNLQIGENTRLIATVKAQSPVVWSTTDPEIAAVDKNGKVTAKKDGTTTITVKTLKKSYNGKALVKTCKVTVTHTHNYVTEKYVKATCTDNGYEDLSCTICKDSQHKVLSATGHDYKITAQKAATCTEDGYKTYTCNNCQQEKTDIISKLNHNMEHVATVEPTCEKDGYKTYRCKNCDIENNEKINKLGHDFTKKIEHKDSTCGVQGYDLYQCSRCEKTEKKELSFTDHNLVKQKEDLEYVYYKCRNCGEEKKEYNDKEYTIDLGDGKTTTVFGHYNLTMPNELLELSNQEREIFDSNPLKMVKETCELQKIANLRAVELSYDYEKRHTRPNGEYVLDSFYDIDAENLTTGKDTATSNEIFKTWMISPQHKETIINNSYRTIAISAFSKKRSNGTYVNYFVQLFSTHSLEMWNE